MLQKLDTTQLRENNVNLVRDAFRALATATTARAAEMTGLSVATCGKIVADMVRSGEIFALELDRTGGGRPPRLYAYNPMFSLTALVFPKTANGVTSIVYAIVDAKGGMVERDAVVVDQAGVPEIRQLLGGKLRQYPAIKAVALSIPGLIRDGVVGFCDLPELADTDLAAALHLPDGVALTMDNDMNLAALGYYQMEMGAGSVAYIVVPRKNCTGAGIVVDGRVIRGHTNFAGELSFAPLGVDRARQFAGMPEADALDYAAALAATVIAVLNPAVLVVASEAMNDDAAEVMRGQCARHIPSEHLPAFAWRRSLDDDCLSGLAIAAARASRSTAIPSRE